MTLPTGKELEPFDAELTGRVAVVTGAASGIGLEVAAGLAVLGATVVLVARPGRVEAARSSLVARGLDSARLLIGSADLSRPAEVTALGAELAQRHERIDVLVNNAACYPAGRHLTEDGFEESWATNVLAYEALTTTLADRLRAASGRLVYVSSSMAGGLRADDLLWDRRVFTGARAYAASKQANRMLAWAWARRLAPAVAVNVAHPDGTATGIANRQRGVWGWIVRRGFATQRPPAVGADTPLWLAAAPGTASSSGGFYVRRGLLADRYAVDVDGCDSLWQLTQDQLKPYL